MKKHILFFAALIFIAKEAAAQSTPCAPNTSVCVATVRTGLCTWYAPANGIVDPDATCTTVGGAFSGEYWMEFTTAATTANIGVTVKQSTGGGSLPLNNPAFQIFQRTAACAPGTYTPLSACNSTGSYNNNLGGGVNEAEEISVSGSTTYLIRVYDADRLMGCSGGGQNKEFILCMRETGQTGCASKRISSLPFDSGILNNTGFGNDNTAGCNAKSSAVNAAGEDYWFVYNSVGDQYVKLELIGTSAAVKVGVKVSKRGTNCNAASFPCYNTAVVRYFDGAINAAIGQTDAIPATIYLETSGDYYFIFDTDGIVTSNFQFKLSSFTPSGSDICSGALTIDPVSTSIPLFNDYDYTGDAIAASSSQPGRLNNNVMRDGCGYATENTKWLTFTTNGAGDVTLNFTSMSCINADNGFVPQLQLVTIHNAAFDANCTSAWIQDGSCFNTATDFSYTPVTAPPAGRTYFVMIDGNAGAHCTFSISASNTVPAASNTITTSAIAPTTYCAGSAVSVPYTITGSYNPANIFTAQLSNSAGSFAAPTSIGTLASQIAGTISATIPPGTSSGSGYRIRVISSDPVVTGSDNGADITINALPTITLGSNPSVCSGATSANLTYSATTGTPDQYSIDYDAAAVAQGFVDVVNAALPASPIVLTVPGAAATGTYNYTVTVRNSATGCVSGSTAKTISVNVVPTIGF